LLLLSGPGINVRYKYRARRQIFHTVSISPRVVSVAIITPFAYVLVGRGMVVGTVIVVSDRFRGDVLFLRVDVLQMDKPERVPLFGNFPTAALGFDHTADSYRNVYYRLAGRKYGVLFPDPEPVNNVLIKDFSYFSDRGVYSDFSVNPLSNNLFFMDNLQCRAIRNKLSPAFMSGKLKSVYGQIEQCGDEPMRNVRNNLTRIGDEMEVRDVLGNYSTDVI